MSLRSNVWPSRGTAEQISLLQDSGRKLLQVEEDSKPNSIFSEVFSSFRAKYGQRVLLAAAPDSSPTDAPHKAFVEVNVPTALCLLPASAMQSMRVYMMQ